MSDRNEAQSDPPSTAAPETPEATQELSGESLDAVAGGITGGCTPVWPPINPTFPPWEPPPFNPFEIA